MDLRQVWSDMGDSGRYWTLLDNVGQWWLPQVKRGTTLGRWGSGQFFEFSDNYITSCCAAAAHTAGNHIRFMAYRGCFIEKLALTSFCIHIS